MASALTSWQPAANGIVNAVAITGSGLLAGGAFTALGYPPAGAPHQMVEPDVTYRGGLAFLRALPDAPGPVSAAPGDGTITVTVQPPFLGGGTLVSYAVTVTPGGTTMSGTGTEYMFAGLANGTPYTFSATATTTIGTGPAAVSAPVSPRTLPDAPTGVTAAPGDESATVSFAAPAFDGGAPVGSYVVRASPGPRTATGTGSPITVTGLHNDDELHVHGDRRERRGRGPRLRTVPSGDPARGRSQASFRPRPRAAPRRPGAADDHDAAPGASPPLVTGAATLRAPRKGTGMRRVRALAVALGAALLLVGGTASGFGPEPVSTWVASGGFFGGGSVQAVAVSGSTAYVGGYFSYVGPPTGSFVSVDTTTGALATPWPVVGGTVSAVVADGQGGWFIGGLFGTIGRRGSTTSPTSRPTARSTRAGPAAPTAR